LCELEQFSQIQSHIILALHASMCMTVHGQFSGLIILNLKFGINKVLHSYVLCYVIIKVNKAKLNITNIYDEGYTHIHAHRFTKFDMHLAR